MGEQFSPSLKWLLEQLPPGAFVDSRWLTAHGVLRSSLAYYNRVGWLKRVAHGLYQRPETTSVSGLAADWRMLLLSTQALMGYRLHVGGMTTLREQGHSHDLSFGPRPVHVYGSPVPGWLRKLPTNDPLCFHPTLIFTEPSLCIGPDADTKTNEASSPWWKRSLRRSEPERAILEAIDELPEEESFSTIDHIFEGLVALRPRRLTAALEACTSIKTKRLFFVFAERHAHAWMKHVERARVDLGTGDRSLVKGGKLHPVFRITVPEELLASAQERHDGR